jgi:hypothetical protein
MASDRVRTTCPTCHTRLTVDAGTGEILAHKKPRRKGSESLEQRLKREKARERRRDEVFSKALDRQRRRDELLEKKFEEAKDHAVDPLKEIEED